MATQKKVQHQPEDFLRWETKNYIVQLIPEQKSPASGKGRSSSSANKPFRREAGAVICLLLAIFSAFGYFHMKALFIDFFCGLVKGLFGYGFWLVPPALLLGSYILAFHRDARWLCA